MVIDSSSLMAIVLAEPDAYVYAEIIIQAEDFRHTDIQSVLRVH